MIGPTGATGTTGATGATGPTGPTGTVAAAVEGVATGSVTTTSSVYVGLLGGPSVDAEVPDSGRVLIILTAELSDSNNNTTVFMSVSIDGSFALDTNSLRVTGDREVRASVMVLLTGLTPGTHTFTTVYKRIGSGTATVNARQITVIPN